MIMELFIHPLCFSSYILIKELYTRGVIDEVRLVDLSNALSDVL